MAMTEKQFVRFGLFLLKEAVFGVVEKTPNLSTTKIGKELRLDESIGTQNSMVADRILKLLKKEGRVDFERVGREVQWRIVE